MKLSLTADFPSKVATLVKALVETTEEKLPLFLPIELNEVQ